ncbi:hypothetical protein LCGC14_2428930, partial [marine sediment metagenome]
VKRNLWATQQNGILAPKRMNFPIDGLELYLPLWHPELSGSPITAKIPLGGGIAGTVTGALHVPPTHRFFDGVYDKNPNLDGSARIIEEIPMAVFSDTASLLENTAAGKGSRFSSGGMKSKLEAARIATKSGIGVVIANGKDIDLSALFEGKRIGTLCLPTEKKIRGKKKWIAFNPKVEGKIVIDRGGERAIVKEKKSLLPAGVREVIGRFEIGGNVSIRNEDNVEIARGLTNFSSQLKNKHRCRVLEKAKHQLID